MKRGKKENVMLYMDSKVVEEAKEVGLNLSKVCENALKRAVEALKATSSRFNQDPPANLLKPDSIKTMCRRVGGRPSGESLRKLCPSSRLAGPEGLGREARHWHRNGTYRLAL